MREKIEKLIPESYKKDAVAFLADVADSSEKLSVRDQKISRELGPVLQRDMGKLVKALKEA